MGLVSSAWIEGPPDSPHAYRYALTRDWGAGARVTWLMLNPSTADAAADDPTIRKCIGFSKLWGAGSLCVVNLFAWRATDASELARVADPVGPRNDQAILGALNAHAAIARYYPPDRHRPDLVLAWGRSGGALARPHIASVLALVAGFNDGRSPNEQLGVWCLKRNADHSPAHPLMLPYRTVPLQFVTVAL